MLQLIIPDFHFASSLIPTRGVDHNYTGSGSRALVFTHTGTRHLKIHIARVLYLAHFPHVIF